MVEANRRDVVRDAERSRGLAGFERWRCGCNTLLLPTRPGVRKHVLFSVYVTKSPIAVHLVLWCNG